MGPVSTFGCVFWGEWNREHLKLILDPLRNAEPLGGILHPSALPHFPYAIDPIRLKDCTYESLQRLVPDLTLHDWLGCLGDSDPQAAVVELEASMFQQGRILLLGEHPLEQLVCRQLTEQLTQKRLLRNIFPRKVMWAMPYSASLHHNVLLNNFRMFSIIPLLLVDRPMLDAEYPKFFTKNHSWPPERRIPAWLLSSYRTVIPKRGLLGWLSHRRPPYQLHTPMSLSRASRHPQLVILP